MILRLSYINAYRYLKVVNLNLKLSTDFERGASADTVRRLTPASVNAGQHSMIFAGLLTYANPMRYR